MNGIIIVNKPKGITSYDVIRFLKRRFRLNVKIGHAGTLDPLASGVLIICTGRATKLSSNFMRMEKEYEARMLLGVTTDTDDIDGKVITEKDVADYDINAIRDITNGFVGEISQVPPIVSALKYKGKPLYKLHRDGIAVKPAARKVLIKEIELLKFEMPYINFRVVCSKGTYIRALCRDIGEKLGCGGTQTELKRTKVGDYLIEKSFSLQEIEQKGLDNCIIPING